MEGSLLQNLKHVLDNLMKKEAQPHHNSVEEETTGSLTKDITDKNYCPTIRLYDSGVSEPDDITDSFAELGSVCEGSSSMLAQRIPPSTVTPATALPPNDEDLSDIQAELSGSYSVSTSQELINNGLLEAAEKNKPEVCRQLLTCQLPAEVNFRGLNDYTALHLAANEGNNAVCTVLIRYGGVVDSRNYMERTPLHLACIRGHYNVVEVLVMHGADINARDIDRNTALHYSAEYGHAMIVSWLLQRRPDLTIRNRLGKTPPDMAASMEVSEIFKEYHRKFESETAAPTAYKRDL
jgi:hypothetical protein